MNDIFLGAGLIWFILAVALFLAPLAIWWHVAKLRKGMEEMYVQHLKRLDGIVAELKRITGAN